MQTHSKRPDDATGVMEVMGSSGDNKHYWNVKKWKDVQAAKEVFDLYKSKGYKPFQMDKNDEKGDEMKEFDPSAGRILFIVQMSGG